MSGKTYDQIKEKLIRHIRQTLEYSKDVSHEDFYENQMFQDAAVFHVMQVGELASRVIELGFDQAHPDIAWRQMRGLRNRIVHDYDGIRLETVWDTITNDFPALLNRLESGASASEDEQVV